MVVWLKGRRPRFYAVRATGRGGSSSTIPTALLSSVTSNQHETHTYVPWVFGLLGLATIVTQLPLFAALGAIVLGITVWRQTERVDNVAKETLA